MKKKEDVYFEYFIDSVDCSYRAAMLLLDFLEHFTPTKVKQKLDEMHGIERENDDRKHDILGVLYKAFITPIEREDIIELSNCLDDITDSIEEILIQMYICRVRSVKPNAVKFLKLLVACLEELKTLSKELYSLKNEKVLMKHIIKINDYEEEGDHLYLESMHSLHAVNQDLLDVLSWREIYTNMEKCMDSCEKAADIVQSVMIKNS